MSTASATVTDPERPISKRTETLLSGSCSGERVRCRSLHPFRALGV